MVHRCLGDRLDDVALCQGPRGLAEQDERRGEQDGHLDRPEQLEREAADVSGDVQLRLEYEYVLDGVCGPAPHARCADYQGDDLYDQQDRHDGGRQCDERPPRSGLLGFRLCQGPSASRAG